MKLVYTHENMFAVHSAKNVLEMNGIDCLLKNEHGNTMGGEFGISNLGEIWVLNADNYEKALKIIESKISNPIEKGSWTCDKCNEENEGNFAICWNCESECASS